MDRRSQELSSESGVEVHKQRRLQPCFTAFLLQDASILDLVRLHPIRVAGAEHLIDLFPEVAIFTTYMRPRLRVLAAQLAEPRDVLVRKALVCALVLVYTWGELTLNGRRSRAQERRRWLSCIAIRRENNPRICDTLVMLVVMTSGEKHGDRGLVSRLAR